MDRLNTLGKSRVPFIFIIDYKKSKVIVHEIDKVPPSISYYIDGFSNTKREKTTKPSFIDIDPISFDEYCKKFDLVIEQIKSGNTYLFNLTAPTKIRTDSSLKNFYNYSKANFKLLYNNKFICFSPERFIKIEDNKIITYPMKGTIDSSIKNAKQKLLDNKKELSEHTMIVDLLRNDLSIVANNIKVDKFRYIQKVNNLFQTSSQISGILDKNWHSNIGNILSQLLPAGSITGTPKLKTIQLIDIIEEYNRDFYTGIFGYYDGHKLDSSVMIRFIQKESGSYIYKSGGGITIDSDIISEYNEMKEKIYI